MCYSTISTKINVTYLHGGCFWGYDLYSTYSSSFRAAGGNHGCSADQGLLSVIRMVVTVLIRLFTFPLALIFRVNTMIRFNSNSLSNCPSKVCGSLPLKSCSLLTVECGQHRDDPSVFGPQPRTEIWSLSNIVSSMLIDIEVEVEA